MRPETRRKALARSGGKCVCGCGRRAKQGHHIWPRGKWSYLADEVDNVVGVAKRCHERHELAVERLPLAVVLAPAERLLRQCVLIEPREVERMRAYLERVYRA